MCLLLTPLSASAQILYATQGCRPCMPYPDGLFTLNPADGTPTLIGNMGESVVGLDVRPLTGDLYGTTTSASANPSSLIRINTSDASVTVIGPHGLDSAIVDLTFAPDGTLCGWIQPNLDQAVRVDLTTGAATPLSFSGLSTSNAAFDLGPTGFFYLFGDNTGFGPPGSIVRLQVADGRPLDAVPLNPFAGERYAAGSFNGGGVLYALRGLTTTNLELVAVDFVTGNVSVMGAVPGYLAVGLELHARDRVAGAARHASARTEPGWNHRARRPARRHRRSAGPAAVPRLIEPNRSGGLAISIGPSGS